MADPMYVVLRWDRHPSWPSGAVGPVVDDQEEAEAIARREAEGARARGSSARFTVHAVQWPPLHDTQPVPAVEPQDLTFERDPKTGEASIVGDAGVPWSG